MTPRDDAPTRASGAGRDAGSRPDASSGPDAGSGRPTMRDVAERVGLSRQLVSIVLRGAPGASEASRERILAAARELGYHPDDSARMLRRRRSGQIGVLFTMRQPFELDVVDALYRSAAARGYTLALGAIGTSRPQEAALAELMRQRIEALIALDAEGAGGIGAERLSGLPGGIPALLLGGPTSDEPHDRVGVENAAGIALAVDHLARLGHERIAYVGPETGPNAAERISGYRAAMHERGLRDRIVPSDYTEAGGYRAAASLLDEGLGGAVAGASGRTSAAPTALVCNNDHCAIGVLQTLVRAGVRVPEDVSVIGFDDSTAAALPFVRLTSVRPDPERLAELAIAAVHARLEAPGAPPSVALVAPTLAVRESTAAPRR
ncbi:LacI family transcriptional regulator [Leucobacter allii]|uniref:LacI family transcriptional regulator n=1 Tax=Leucobacter allii TaxID=2932247 RepID=A0ABY4FL14_9MICO|nr:LacI family DNA-binding transcriptional regulator [Leucobacter allii]UOQ56955.1 LacI family transcriptional regulator [Leucobacter allii]